MEALAAMERFRRGDDDAGTPGSAVDDPVGNHAAGNIQHAQIDAEKRRNPDRHHPGHHHFYRRMPVTVETPHNGERYKPLDSRDQTENGNHQPDVIHSLILIEYGNLRIVGAKEISKISENGDIMKADTLAHIAAVFSAASGALIAIFATSLLLAGLQSATLQLRRSVPQRKRTQPPASEKRRE